VGAKDSRRVVYNCTARARCRARATLVCGAGAGARPPSGPRRVRGGPLPSDDPAPGHATPHVQPGEGSRRRCSTWGCCWLSRVMSRAHGPPGSRPSTPAGQGSAVCSPTMCQLSSPQRSLHPTAPPRWQRIDLRGGTPSEPPDGPSTLACRCSEADLLLGGRRHPGVAAMTVGHWIHRVVLVRLRNQYVGSLAGPDDRAGVDLLRTVCQSFDPRRPLMAGRFDVRGSIDGVGGTSHRRLR
jgi:hypothetical protein